MSVPPPTCENQHSISDVDPMSWPNDTGVALTLTGNYLELVTQVKLVPVVGGLEIIGSTPVVGPGPDETSLTSTFQTTDAQTGVYHVVTDQLWPCLPQQISDAFTITCPDPTIISGLAPNSRTDPSNPFMITISGTEVTQLSSVALVLGSDMAVVPGVGLAIVGETVQATFDMGCVPVGTYHMRGTRGDGCPVAVPESAGDDAFVVRETLPTEGCAWQPWARDWSALNLGPDLDPLNEIYNPTNWDYSFSQDTVLGTTQDTPDGSALALHWFLDAQPPAAVGDGVGSGGVFQEVTVTPGVPLEYSFWWKGATNVDESWFEFLLIDGPFSIWDADGFDEDVEQTNNPSMMRKTKLEGATLSFDWAQVTDQTAADTGPFGDRPTTITPTGSVVAVVLKAGRYPPGSMESFFDDVRVWQGVGPNLITNGDFETVDQVWPCDNTAMAQDFCEQESWRQTYFEILPPCPDPFANFDDDEDVDQDDFQAFQACFTGNNGVAASGCECFDRPEPDDRDGDVDELDLAKFEVCASGPDVPADPLCDGI